MIYKAFSHTRQDAIAGTTYFWLDRAGVDPTTPLESVVILREDRKFLLAGDQAYRVCELNLPQDDDPPYYIKVWHRDPFAGLDGYEQVDNALRGMA